MARGAFDIASRIGDEGLAPLAALKGLQKLSLKYTDVTDEGIAQLAALTQELLRDSSRRHALATAAGVWRKENSGAVARTLAIVRAELAKR